MTNCLLQVLFCNFLIGEPVAISVVWVTVAWYMCVHCSASLEWSLWPCSIQTRNMILIIRDTTNAFQTALMQKDLYIRWPNSQLAIGWSMLEPLFSTCHLTDDFFPNSQFDRIANYAAQQDNKSNLSLTLKINVVAKMRLLSQLF